MTGAFLIPPPDVTGVVVVARIEVRLTADGCGEERLEEHGKPPLRRLLR